MMRPPHLPRSSEAPKTATRLGAKICAIERRGAASIGMAGSSAAFELWLALLDHRVNAFLDILGGADDAVPTLGQQHRAVGRIVILRADRLLDGADRQGRAAGEFVGDARHLRIEAVV